MQGSRRNAYKKPIQGSAVKYVVVDSSIYKSELSID